MATLLTFPGWIGHQMFFGGNLILREIVPGSAEYTAIGMSDFRNLCRPFDTAMPVRTIPVPAAFNVPPEILYSSMRSPSRQFEPSALHAAVSESRSPHRSPVQALKFDLSGNDYGVETPDIFGGDDELDASLTAHMANHRKYYHTQLSHLSLAERLGRAMHADGYMLLALCFDPDPTVIAKVMENRSSNLACARLIAMHSTSSASLLAIEKKPSFLFDSGIQWHLIRNAVTPIPLLRRIFGTVPMRTLYTIRAGSDVAEHAKLLAAEVLRERFRAASGGECATLILATEGRCLKYLSQEHLSNETVDILCSHDINSDTLAENMVKFPGLTPKLIRHLMKQTIVRRNVRWRQILLSKPACPADLRRK